MTQLNLFLYTTIYCCFTLVKPPVCDFNMYLEFYVTGTFIKTFYLISYNGKKASNNANQNK